MAVTVRPRPGFTLIELIVVLAVLGVMAGVVGLALRTPRDATGPVDAWRRTVAAARARALTTGHPVHVGPSRSESGDTGGREFTAFPDGSVVATSGDGPDTTGRPHAVDRLTGSVADDVGARRGAR